MNKLLDYFYDGCDIYGKVKYGNGYKTHRDTEQINGMTEFAIYYMIYTLITSNEKNTTKTKSKANTKSKRKDGKQVKDLLRTKKRVPTK
jgi:hypothetical protein